MKDLICSISPVVLSYVLINFRLDVAIVSILIVQSALFTGYMFLTKNKNRELKKVMITDL